MEPQPSTWLEGQEFQGAARLRHVLRAGQRRRGMRREAGRLGGDGDRRPLSRACGCSSCSAVLSGSCSRVSRCVVGKSTWG